jgi:two-component system, OmpR family, response regulator
LPHRPLKRVLVVDDDADLLAVVSLALGGLGGLAVETCSCPLAAVEIARECGPDLVLLDLMMPTLDGFSVLRGLRENPSTGSLPVVLMSAQADMRQRSQYEAMGCVGVIRKPFDPVALPARLEELWEAHWDARISAHQAEFEGLRLAYIGELSEKMAAMQAAASQLAAVGWDRSVVESLAHLAHRVAGSAGLYRLAGVSRSASALEQIVNRMLAGPTWPPATPASDLARLVKAVGRTARAEAGASTPRAMKAPDAGSTSAV